MSTYEIESRRRRVQPTAVAETTLSAEELASWLDRTFQAVAAVVTAQGAYPAGPPFARYRMLGERRFGVEAGFPVTATITAIGEIHPSTLPGGEVATTIHTGPYDKVEPAYAALVSWVRAHGGELAGNAWEVYYSSPAEQPDPATWRTEVVQPYHPAQPGEDTGPAVP
jgi:effector-binding domain-containing protein